MESMLEKEGIPPDEQHAKKTKNHEALLSHHKENGCTNDNVFVKYSQIKRPDSVWLLVVALYLIYFSYVSVIFYLFIYYFNLFYSYIFIINMFKILK